MAKKALIILADGFEEIEATAPIDILRRAGVHVTVAGLYKEVVKGAHELQFETDLLLADYKEKPDALILPGGMPGAQNLGNSKEVLDLIRSLNKEKKIIGAICAAPALVLNAAGVLKGKRATCYPSFETKFDASVQFSESRVVVDGTIITSRGPGSAIEFALELVRQLVGEEMVKQLKEGLLAKV